jgi:hypothetical protein
MLRAVCAGAVVAAIVASGSVDLSACGDKFLRIGRSARFRGYAAVHPASILVYKPMNSTPAGVREFETMLKRAGHKPVFLENGAGLRQAVAAAKYDLVIADYADAGKIKDEIQSVPSRPELLPILNKPTKAVEAEAEKAYHCLIKPHAMSKYDALAEIDHLLELRLKASTQPAAK